MGTLCPVCGTYQPFKRWITADMKPARKASDNIAVELTCGHIMGGGELTAYLEKVRLIRTEEAQAKLEVEKAAREKLAAAWKELTAKKGGEAS